MSTHLSSDLQVAQEQTLHVALGKVTHDKKQRKVGEKSKTETKGNTGVHTKRARCSRSQKCRSRGKQGKSGKANLHVPDVHVDPNTDDKVSTPKNPTNMQNVSHGDVDGTHDTSMQGSIPAENGSNTNETMYVPFEPLSPDEN